VCNFLAAHNIPAERFTSDDGHETIRIAVDGGVTMLVTPAAGSGYAFRIPGCDVEGHFEKMSQFVGVLLECGAYELGSFA
jgi:hypothetical protein